MARPPRHNAEYFSHDSNMRNNKRIEALRNKFGFTGYAIYNMLLEALTGADYTRIIYDDDDELEIMASGDFKIDTEELKAIIEYCIKPLKLFQIIEAEAPQITGGVSVTETHSYIICTELNRRLEPVFTKRQKAIERIKNLKNGVVATETNLIKGVSVTETPQESDIPVTETPQSKVKGSKQKKRKIREEKEAGSISSKNNVLKEEFEKARILYPGTKRGLTTEFDYFKSKHKDWKEIIPLLFNAISNQIAHRDTMQAEKNRTKSKDIFIPHWPNMQTWLNQNRWEEEYQGSIIQSNQIVKLLGPDWYNELSDGDVFRIADGFYQKDDSNTYSIYYGFTDPSKMPKFPNRTAYMTSGLINQEPTTIHRMSENND